MPTLMLFRFVRGIAKGFPCGVILLAALCLIGAGCKPPVAKAPEKKPAEVFVALPVTEKVTEYEEFTGYLAAKETIEIRARVSGYLDAVKFVEGAEVKANDLLFEIDKRVYKANAANAAALLGQAKAKRDGLTSQYKRAQELLRRDAISKEDAEVLQYQLAEAEAAVAAAEATKESAELDLSYTAIKAPIDGVISNRRIDPGNLVKADETLMGMIVSQDPIYAYFDVNERTVLRLRRLLTNGRLEAAVASNLEVRASLADEEDFQHIGHINFVDNQLDAATGTLRVRAVLANKDRLLSPGLFVRLRFPIGSAQDALLVQEESLGADQGERYLYVVDKEGVVNYRRVKIGVLREGKRVIREGLAANERVIVTGLQRVKPGDKVTTKNYTPPVAGTSPGKNITEVKAAKKPDGAEASPKEKSPKEVTPVGESGAAPTAS